MQVSHCKSPSYSHSLREFNSYRFSMHAQAKGGWETHQLQRESRSSSADAFRGGSASAFAWGEMRSQGQRLHDRVVPQATQIRNPVVFFTPTTEGVCTQKSVPVAPCTTRPPQSSGHFELAHDGDPYGTCSAQLEVALKPTQNRVPPAARGC